MPIAKLNIFRTSASVRFAMIGARTAMSSERAHVPALNVLHLVLALTIGTWGVLPVFFLWGSIPEPDVSRPLACVSHAARCIRLRSRRLGRRSRLFFGPGPLRARPHGARRCGARPAKPKVGSPEVNRPGSSRCAHQSTSGAPSRQAQSEAGVIPRRRGDRGWAAGARTVRSVNGRRPNDVGRVVLNQQV